MKALLPVALAATIALSAPVLPTAARADAPPAVSPSAVLAAAPQEDWRAIAPEDLLVMDMAPDATGPRRVVIQLIPGPLSAPWVGNIRKLAAAHWWDGLSVYRVQDNYVAQWGDAEGDDKAKAKPLPAGLAKPTPAEYTLRVFATPDFINPWKDPYAANTGVDMGFPVGFGDDHMWPLHCYASVGVARDLTPDTGTGAELYAVIGHAPRQLDRNIAVVGRVIEGIDRLSSLPRGDAPMGVYKDAGRRVPIVRVRLASELPEAERPRYEFLNPAAKSFADYVKARANRRDSFYFQPPDGLDACSLAPMPRKVPAAR